MMSEQMITLNENEMKAGYNHSSKRKGILAHLCGFRSKSKQSRVLCNDTYPVKTESQVVRAGCREITGEEQVS